MKILFNTDKTINGEERNEDFFTAKIKDELARFQTHITRIEVHISDENGKKKGFNDILCSLEARLEGKKPIAVTHQADNVALAVSGAIDKLKASLKTILDQIKNY